MNRRQFIRHTAVSSVVCTFLPHSYSSASGQSPAAKPDLVIYADGTFDIHTNGLGIYQCYPGIDRKRLAVVNINVNRRSTATRVDYYLKKGRITLHFEYKGDTLTLASELQDLPCCPDQFNPIAGAVIQGADRFFKQGMGFAGPSGFYPFPQPRPRIEKAQLKSDVWSYDSYLISGIISDHDQALIMAAFDHNTFLHKSTFYNKQSRFGLIDRHLDSDMICFDTGFYLEKILQSDNKIKFPDLCFSCGNPSFPVFRAMAHRIADFNQVKLNCTPKYYYCSWYEFEKEFSREKLDNLLAGLESMQQKPPLQAIQIDDGYCYYGDWLETNDKWPLGLKSAFDGIQNAGYKAGIWVAPFMVSSRSNIYKNHPDWLLRDKNGNLIIEWEKKDGEQVLVLDSSHPDAFEYTRSVFRTLREWGAAYFKTDFMDWGLRDSKKVKRHTPGKTSVQYFHDVVKMIRKEISPESYWLGCISPFQQMIGFADAVRVSNDIWSWESALNMFRETMADQPMNNVLWQSDPDVIYLRDYDTPFSETERRTIALWNGILGGTLTTSDRFPTLNEKVLDLWQFLIPRERHTAELPFWSHDTDHPVAVRRFPELGTWAVLFVNTTDVLYEQDYKIKDLTGHQTVYCFEWDMEGSKSGAQLGALSVKLDPHACRLYYLNSENQPAPAELGLGGLR